MLTPSVEQDPAPAPAPAPAPTSAPAPAPTSASTPAPASVSAAVALVLAFPVLGSVACRTAPDAVDSAGAPSSDSAEGGSDLVDLTVAGQESRFPIEGEVVAVDAERRLITLAHEPIEGLMPAMTMDFGVGARGDWLLETAAPGARLRAELVVPGAPDEELSTGDGGDTDGGQVGAVANTEPGSSRLANAVVWRPAENRVVEIVPIAEPGTALPAIGLIDQDENGLRLEDYRGEVLVFSFIYTRCPLPDFCPRMSQRLAAAHEAIGRQPETYGAGTQLLSITIDVDNDTPAVLREYGLRYLADGDQPFDRWRFATTTLNELRELTQLVGLRFVPERGEFAHSLRIVIVDRAGLVAKIHVGNTWTAEELLADIEAVVATGRPAPSAP